MKIIKWITIKEAEGKEENGLGGWGGFFEYGMRWKDYLANFKEEAHSDLEELRREIIKEGIKCTGEERQERGGKVVPLWENGKVDTYTWRAWGDLMAAVWSEEENKDYSYMSFYM